MTESDELARLREQLEVARAQRDSTMLALEEHQAEADDRVRLLTEEQDRFVSRLIEAHEKELGMLTGELEEARVAQGRLHKKLERAKRDALTAEEELLGTRCMIDKLRAQADNNATAQRSLTTERNALAVRAARLNAELDMARTLLGYAMDGADNRPTPVAPGRSTAAPVIPRTSGIVGPRKAGPRSRESSGSHELGLTGVTDRRGR